jgi:SAM-dependent methyltransferase
MHGRTREQVWNHYVVESDIARRLKAADHEQRKAIYASMYDELFARVPDHPRLTRRTSPERTARANRNKMALLGRVLAPRGTVLEFAPGDCRFAAVVAGRVGEVIGVDISDQRAPGEPWPPNLRLVVYDGYGLDEIPDASVDVIFSDQLIEHLHPEDVLAHFRLAHRLLRDGGCYAMRTPHAVSGPWDVSRHFCEHPEGFHLKEWTVTELRRALLELGYRRVDCYWGLRSVQRRLPFAYFQAMEALLQRAPRGLAQRLARVLLPSVTCFAYR